MTDLYSAVCLGPTSDALCQACLKYHVASKHHYVLNGRVQVVLCLKCRADLSVVFTIEEAKLPCQS